MAVTSLLPGDTLLVMHLSDFNRTRDQWHQTDIYKIRQEPAVRDFSRKPLSKIPKSGTTSQNLAEFERLEPKDFFLCRHFMDKWPEIGGRIPVSKGRRTTRKKF